MMTRFLDHIFEGLAPIKRHGPAVVLLLVWNFFGINPAPAYAQDSTGASSVTTENKNPKGEETTSVGDLMSHSGLAVWVCLLLSVLVMTFTVEGFLKLRFTALCPPAQLEHLQALMGEYRYQEAWEFCREQNNFLCTVVQAGLERIGRGSEATEYTLQEVVSQQAILLKMNSHYLSAIGVVAPMIGLSGTVMGMIKAFKQLGTSINGDPAGLASAIGQVLTATLAGLLVAIPGFVFYYVLKARAQTAIMLADSAIYHLFEDVPFERIIGFRVEVSRPATPELSIEQES